MSDYLKTINVEHPDGYAVINEADFDKNVHTLYTGKEQPSENSVAHNSKGKAPELANEKQTGTRKGKRGKGRGKGDNVHTVAEDEGTGTGSGNQAS